MMNKEPNGADMILQLLGKGECFSNQSADPLPDGAIKALDITGLAGFFVNWTMSFAGNDSLIGFPEIGVTDGTLPINRSYRRP